MHLDAHGMLKNKIYLQSSKLHWLGKGLRSSLEGASFDAKLLENAPLLKTVLKWWIVWGEVGNPFLGHFNSWTYRERGVWFLFERCCNVMMQKAVGHSRNKLEQGRYKPKSDRDPHGGYALWGWKRILWENLKSHQNKAAPFFSSLNLACKLWCINYAAQMGKWNTRTKR